MKLAEADLIFVNPGRELMRTERGACGATRSSPFSGLLEGEGRWTG